MEIEVAFDDLSNPQALPLGSPREGLPHLLHGGAREPAIPTIHLLLHSRRLLLLLYLPIVLPHLLPIPRPIGLGSKAGGENEEVIGVVAGGVGGKAAEVVGGVDGSGGDPEEEESSGSGAEEQEESGEAKPVMPPSRWRRRPEKPHHRSDLSDETKSRAFIKAYYYQGTRQGSLPPVPLINYSTRVF